MWIAARSRFARRRKDERGERGNLGIRRTPIAIHTPDQVARLRKPPMCENRGEKRRSGGASIRRLRRRLQCLSTHRIAATLVTDSPAPATSARFRTVTVSAERDAPGTGDHRDTYRVRQAR